MTGQKRFATFTLGRLPFLVFIAAGISGLTLSTLFQGAVSAGIVVAMSIAVITTSLAARFRDVGISAWLSPLGLLPAVALLVGFTPGDGVGGPKAEAAHPFIHSLLFTLMCGGISVALLVN